MNRQSFSTVGRYTVASASLDAAHVSGTGGSLYPRLFIQLRLELHPLHEAGVDCAFSVLDAQLHHDRMGKIADATPCRLQRVQRAHHSFQMEEFAYLEFPLDARRIDALEQLRDGKDLPLRLDLFLSGEEHAVIPGDEKAKRPALWGMRSLFRLIAQLPFTVPRSRWIENVLPPMGYGVIHIVELPAVPLAACEALQHSYEALRLAQSLHRQGHYDEAVTKCRIALDPFFDYVPVDPSHKDSRRIPQLKKSWETKLGEATAKWFNATLGAIKEAANPTAHSPNRHFDQFESQMLQAITTTVVSYAARSLDTTTAPVAAGST